MPFDSHLQGALNTTRVTTVKGAVTIGTAIIYTVNHCLFRENSLSIELTGIWDPSHTLVAVCWLSYCETATFELVNCCTEERT